MNGTAWRKNCDEIYDKKIWKVALYMRLSKDDEEYGDSTSIQTQRKILTEYAKNHGFVIVDEFVDDGWSGTNFNRPSFKRMIKSIERGEINCVITKDLARFGRNYIEAGDYLESYFPERGIRYISINENVDTLKGDNDFVPVMNVFNEMYAKQTSKKVRQAYETMFLAGECHYTYVPIGFIKDPNNKRNIIVDNETAWIIDKITRLYDENGFGAKKIQNWLFENKVENPGYRQYIKNGGFSRVYDNAPEYRRYQWELSTIKKILRDPIYIGHSVHYKDRSISFKNRKKRKLPKDQWIVVEDAHPAIIPKDRYYRNQKRLDSRITKRSTSDGELQVFSGIAFCADCGSTLRFGTNRQSKEEYSYLACPQKDRGIGDHKCTMHYVRYDNLQEVVLSQIQHLYKMVDLDKDAVLNRIIKVNKEEGSDQAENDKNELFRLEKRNKEIENVFVKLYEDWASGRVSEDMFSMMSSRFQSEQKEIKEKLSIIKLREKEEKDNTAQIRGWIKKINNLSYPTTLTHDLVISLIDKIVVYESEGLKGSKNKKQKIDIHWKFVGDISL